MQCDGDSGGQPGRLRRRGAVALWIDALARTQQLLRKLPRGLALTLLATECAVATSLLSPALLFILGETPFQNAHVFICIIFKDLDGLFSLASIHRSQISSNTLGNSINNPF